MVKLNTAKHKNGQVRRTYSPLDGAADLLGFNFGGCRGTGVGSVLWHTSFGDGFSEKHTETLNRLYQVIL